MARIKDTVGLLLAALILTCLVLALFFLPIKHYLIVFLNWQQATAVWGFFALCVIYVLAPPLFLPNSLLSIAAGYLFGLAGGVTLVEATFTLGACISFLVGRTFARQWVSSHVARRPKLKALDELVGQQGFTIVFLTRLTPLFPFHVLSYAYGISQVSLLRYALATFLGIIPLVAMYVYVGCAARASFTSLDELAARKAFSFPHGLAPWIGAATAVIVAGIVSYFAVRLVGNLHKQRVDRKGGRAP